jgi:hypothetical protein
MTQDKLIETILEIGMLARSINDHKLNDNDKRKLGLIKKLCENIEIDSKEKLRNDFTR